MCHAYQVMNMIKTNTGTLELIVHIKNNSANHSTTNGTSPPDAPGGDGTTHAALAHAPKGGFAMRNSQVGVDNRGQRGCACPTRHD